MRCVVGIEFGEMEESTDGVDGRVLDVVAGDCFLVTRWGLASASTHQAVQMEGRCKRWGNTSTACSWLTTYRPYE